MDVVAVVLSDPLVVLETVLVLEGLLGVGVIAWDVVVLATLETVITDPFVMLIKGASELPIVLVLGTVLALTVELALVLGPAVDVDVEEGMVELVDVTLGKSSQF